jgi:hypothetical protein
MISSAEALILKAKRKITRGKLIKILFMLHAFHEISRFIPSLTKLLFNILLTFTLDEVNKFLSIGRRLAFCNKRDGA